MVGRLGLGPAGSLAWSEALGPAHAIEVEKLLSTAYASAKQKLQARKAEVEALANALVQRQELTGPEVLQILRAP
jgi:ATP-dependent Zn protease